MESRKRKITKGALLIFIMMCLFVPLTEGFLNLIPIKPLGGAVVAEPEPIISLEKWMDGELQKSTEKYLEQNFGIRNFLVRLNNQIDFCFFNKLSAVGVVCGKENMLYESWYIDAYYGVNATDEKVADDLIKKVKRVQDGLAAQNKTLLVVFAPSKARFYPEYFPPNMVKPQNRGNYEIFNEAMIRHGVNLIDVNKWFLELKGKSKYPLFSNLGTHWSLYGSAIAFDSIASFVEKKRNIDLPECYVKRYESPDTLRYPDDDIYKGTNLLFKLPHEKMTYPVLGVHEDPIKARPTLLTIGDSFWWNIQNTSVGDYVFKEGQFWYYGQEAYPASFTNKTLVETLDYKAIIKKTDVVVFCYTECTIGGAGNGFLEKAEAYFQSSESKSSEKDIKIKNLIEYIKSNKKWMDEIKQRAIKQRVTVDSLIRYDATWQVMFNNDVN